MAKVLTTDGLIETVLRRGMIPDNQVTFSRSDIIDMLNEEMSISILPVVLKTHEEYYAYSETETLVTGKSRYQIPYRSIGTKLRDLHYQNANGELYEMTRISPNHRSDSQSSYTTGFYNEFYLEGSNVVLTDSLLPTSTGSLLFSYYLRPNELVETSRAGTITAIDTATGIVTMSTFPTNLVSAPLLDFVAYRSPNKIRGFDIAPISIDQNAKTITFDVDDLPEGLIVGDYVMQAEETIVAQLPTELLPILAQKTTIKCLEALGDTEGVTMAEKDLTKMEKNAYSLIDNRVEGAPQKVVNRNSFLKNKNRYRRGAF